MTWYKHTTSSVVFRGNYYLILKKFQQVAMTIQYQPGGDEAEVLRNRLGSIKPATWREKTVVFNNLEPTVPPKVNEEECRKFFRWFFSPR